MGTPERQVAASLVRSAGIGIDHQEEDSSLEEAGLHIARVVDIPEEAGSLVQGVHTGPEEGTGLDPGTELSEDRLPFFKKVTILKTKKWFGTNEEPSVLGGSTGPG